MRLASQLASTGINDVSIADPMRAAVVLSDVYATARAAHSSSPLVACPGRNYWVGRCIRYRTQRCAPPATTASLPRRWAALTTLQLLRVIFLAGSVVLWFASIHWAAGATLWGDSPNIIGYCALVVGLSLGISTLWALVSWVFSIAPLLVLLENRGIVSSLARSLRLGPLKGKLVEINLIMGIIKLALMVLAMVWSAMPLPFEAEVQGASLYAWWAVGTILLPASLHISSRLPAWPHSSSFWRAFQPRNLNTNCKRLLSASNPLKCIVDTSSIVILDFGCAVHPADRAPHP